MIKYIIIFLMFCSPVPTISAPLPNVEKETSAYVVNEAIIFFANKNSANPQSVPFFIDGLMVALLQLDNPVSAKLFVDLYDYYLGSAFGTQLDILSSNHGKILLNQLKEKLGSISICNTIDRKLYPSIQCLTIKQRDERIKRVINAIEEDKPYDYIP